MARSFSVWIPIKALLHGIVAVALSYTAYSKRIKGEDVTNASGNCSYPDSQAWFIGIFAALALLAEQITISVGMKCFCSRGRHIGFSSKCLTIISIILLILSWLSFAITFIGLIYTSVVNNHTYLVKFHSKSNDRGNCFIEKENLFLGTAYWCIFTTVLGLISYAFWACGTTLTTTNNDFSSRYGQGVAMGQPHTQLSKEEC